jgi:hypothetical protein
MIHQSGSQTAAVFLLRLCAEGNSAALVLDKWSHRSYINDDMGVPYE